jgi:two-component sensor histidine kinase
MNIANDNTNLIELVKSLQKEMLNRKWAEKKASDALDYAESIIDSVKNPLIVLDDEYKVVSTNIPFYQLFSLTMDSVIGKNLFEISDGLFNISELKNIIYFNEEERKTTLEIDFKILGNKYLEISCFDLQYNIKHLKFKLVVISDITDLMSIQKNLELSNKKSSLLIKEIYHRTFNNFASIQMLLELEIENSEKQVPIEIIQISISRIENLCIYYKKLQESSDLSSISTKKYFSTLIDSVVELLFNKVPIKIEKNIDDFDLNGNIGFALGLIINELITNSMKYAFIGRDSGIIFFSMKNQNNHIVVEIKDNGVGFQNNLKNEKSFGMELIDSLITTEIKGKYSIENDNGTKCKIEFDILK